MSHNFSAMTAADLMSFIASVEFGSTEATEATLAFLALQNNAKDAKQRAQDKQAVEQWVAKVNAVAAAIDSLTQAMKPTVATAGMYSEGENTLDLAFSKFSEYVRIVRPNANNGKQGNKRQVTPTGGEKENTAKRTISKDKLHLFVLGENVSELGTLKGGTRTRKIQFVAKHELINGGKRVRVSVALAPNQGKDGLEIVSVKNAFATVMPKFVRTLQYTLTEQECREFIAYKCEEQLPSERTEIAKGFMQWRADIATGIVAVVKEVYGTSSGKTMSASDVFATCAHAERDIAEVAITTLFSAKLPVIVPETVAEIVPETVAEIVAENVPEIPKLPAKGKGKKQTV